MLQTSSLQLEKILIETTLTNEERVTFINFFKKYKKNNFVYPGVIKRNTNLSYELIYEALFSLEKANIVKRQYEVSCGKCPMAIEEIYFSIDAIPEFYYCDICNQELVAVDNAILIFKVV